MFGLLKQDAEKNVETIKAVTKPQGGEIPVRFFDNDSSFGVIRETYKGEIGVRFSLRQDAVSIEGQGVNVSFTATLTLNDEGECRFTVGGQTLDRWQVLRRALEPLFFRAAD